MEGVGRSFQPIHVSVCSAVTGKARYPRNGGVKPPIPVLWRNNLTALSQSWNFYFVAYIDQLHVYKPQFPTQKIGPSPQLVIDLPVTRPGLTGTIDTHIPHAVNHLIVGDLGNEEIILLSCDDGDVLAYTTRSISNIILAKELKKSDVPASSIDFRPFFIRNVGSSAWGLAIHKASRMIAVSANTRRITVFAFALHDKNLEDDVGVSESGSDMDDDEESQNNNDEILNQTEHLTAAPDRSLHDRVIILAGHRDNIPSISFCNTDGDQIGRYLVSTDIKGETLIWDIWAQRVIKRHSKPKELQNDLRGNSRTWGVLCLGIECFRAAKGFPDFFGCEPGHTKGRFEISNKRTSIEDSSLWHPSYSRFSSVPGLNHVSEEGEPSDPLLTIEYSDDDSIEQGLLGEEDQEDVLEMGFPDDDFSAIDATTTTEPIGDHSIGADEMPAGVRATVPKREWVTGTQEPEYKHLPFSVLCTSENEISLFLNPSAHGNIVITEPLYQHLPPNLHWFAQFKRMNMVLQIPELGIVVVASQIGRVALLTLTRMKGTKKCAFRLDWILPFKSQEDQGMRPTVPLLGIAVGPVQGRQFASERMNSSSSHSVERESWRAIESSRRYRLMLTYLDLTILSYEIGRTSAKSGNSGTGNDLLVF